jgi:excisionase family DNA binding protein
MEELIKVSAVAKLLGVEPATVRNMIKQGEFRAINPNSGTQRRAKWRVPLGADMEKLEKSNSTATRLFSGKVR